MDALETETRHKLQELLMPLGRYASLGRLVPVVAHEINNPLALITNNLYLLTRDVEVLENLLRLYQEADPVLANHAPELSRRIQDLSSRSDLTYTVANPAKLLERARTGVRRIQQMVRDLLDSGRPGEKLAHEVDVHAGIAAAVRLLQRRAEKQRVVLQTELMPVPLLTCCPSLVMQVVLQLVQNAIEACPAEATVTVRTRPGTRGVEIEVADTGPGIDLTLEDRIFTPFFTTKPPAEHFGLGLCIAQALVMEQGGRIEVVSRPGHGACFTVHLPLTPSRCLDGKSAKP
jgi:signal transduction histidine kinase